MVCNGKHIGNPVPLKDWKCPRCGNVDGFICDDPENPECEMEHPDDYVSCYKCGFGASMAVVTRSYWKAKGVKWIKCPHCKGTGQIREE